MRNTDLRSHHSSLLRAAFALVLALLLMFTLAACGGGESGEDGGPGNGSGKERDVQAEDPPRQMPGADSRGEKDNVGTPLSAEDDQRRDGPRFVSVDSGSNHACAVTEDGDVLCWGSNKYGQATPPAEKFASVSAGAIYTCGLKDDGDVLCWGHDTGGRPATSPEGKFVSVSANRRICGVTVDDELLCWGSAEPRAEEGAFVSVSVGGDDLCAITVQGSAVCWGDDDYGENGEFTGKFTSVSTGGEWHACAVAEKWRCSLPRLAPRWGYHTS